MPINIDKVLSVVEPEDEEWAFLRVIELLEYAGFDLMLKTFLEKCKTHTNPEIIGLYDDYYAD